ncbi:MAG: hypothetical protein AAGA92_02955 [Planctomycetota bacterium]
MSKRTCLAFFAVLAAAAPPGVYCAERIAASVGRFDSAAFDVERSARSQRLRSELEAFDAKLAAESTAAEREAWHDYLEWEAWAEPFLNTGEINADVARTISKRLFAESEGFEHPQIDRLRWALIEHLDALAAEAGDSAGETLSATATVEAVLQASDYNYAELEEAFWRLAATGQGGALRDALAKQFSGPLIVGQIRRDLVEARVDQFQTTSQETRHTRNRISGASVVGTSTVDTNTTAEMLNGPHGATLRVTARGTVRSPRNVATRDRIRVVSSSDSSFTAVADVYWHGNSLTFSTPQADANTNSRIRSISAPALGRRIAERRVRESRASGEAQAERMIEEQTAESMAERLTKAVAKLNKRTERFLAFLSRTGNQSLEWSTLLREGSVQIGYRPRTRSGLGAPSHRTPPLKGEEAVMLSFHDSAFETLLEKHVAGTVWTDVTFSKMQREVTGGTTEAMMIGLEPERWSVRWSWRRPVSIHFDEEAATIRYRFEWVEIDRERFDAPCEVSQRLDVSADNLGHQLTRLEPVSVTSTDPARPLPTVARNFLERKFERPVSEPFYFDGLQFPAGGELDGFAGFQSLGAQLENHWLHLTYAKRR